MAVYSCHRIKFFRCWMIKYKERLASAMGVILQPLFLFFRLLQYLRNLPEIFYLKILPTINII
jgi:hypothetical protein